MHSEFNRGKYPQRARRQTKYCGKDNIWLDTKEREAFHMEVLGVEHVKSVEEELERYKKGQAEG